jgi:hypothetical protein
MGNLATLEDVEAVLGRDLTDGEFLRVDRLLAMASKKVRTYTGQFFEVVENDLLELVPDAWGQVRLPQRPVTAVASVVVDGETMDADGYTWTAQGALSRTYGYWWTPVTVTYTHGYDTIPDDVAFVVAELVVARFSAPEGGVKSESLGSYSVSYGDTAVAGELSDTQKLALQPYMLPARPVSQHHGKRALTSLDGWL